MRRSIAVTCLVACSLAGCGTGRSTATAERTVATAFARAVIEGRVREARRLVAPGVDPAVRAQATLIATTFARHHGVLQTRARRTDDGAWSFAYRRRINERSGAFSRERGRIVVRVTPGRGPGVSFAALVGRRVVYSTHHDAVLLPSKR